MILFLGLLIQQTLSKISFDGTTLTINYISLITQKNISQYKNATTLVIYSSNDINIDYLAFHGFTSLINISIEAQKINIKYDSFDDCSAIKYIYFTTSSISISSSTFKATSGVTYYYKGSEFGNNFYDFIKYNIDELNVEVSGDAYIYSTEKTKPNIKRIIIKSYHITLMQFALSNVSGEIQLLKFDANTIIDLDTCCFDSTKINEIQFHAGKTINIRGSIFNKNSYVNKMNLISDNDVTITQYALEDANISELNIVGLHKIYFDEKGMEKMADIGKLTFETSNFNASGAFKNSIIHEFVIKCNGTCLFTKNNFLRSDKLNKITIMAGSDIHFDCFYETLIKSVYIESNGSITFRPKKYSLQYSISNLDVRALGDIKFYYFSSSFESVNIISNGSIYFYGDSFSLGECYGDFQVQAENDIYFDIDSFNSVNINSLEVISNGKIDFYYPFQYSIIKNLEMHSVQNITLISNSFLNSNISSIKLFTNEMINFDTLSLARINANVLEIHVNDLTWSEQSFWYSNISFINFYTHSPLVVNYDLFGDLDEVEKIAIHSTSSITFVNYFSRIKKIYINVLNANKNNAIYLDKSPKIIFKNNSFEACPNLTFVNINSIGDVEIQEKAFLDNHMLRRVNVTTIGKVTIYDNAFKNCEKLKKKNVHIDANKKNISNLAFENKANEDDGSGRNEDDEYDDGDDDWSGNSGNDGNDNDGNDNDDGKNDDGNNSNKKKKHGSSHKNDDDEKKEVSARKLGNIEIKSIYLGTSPNIIVNLNIFVSLMKKARKIFGHMIPPPDFVHSAIWVGPEDANDKTLGAIFVYGKYYNKYNSDIYLVNDGAKAYLITFGEFKERYPSIDPIKLKSKRNVKLFNFIDEVKSIGQLRAQNYNWPTNNCQHFTAKLISILQATRNKPQKEDWIHLPKLILNSLESNEKEP